MNVSDGWPTNRRREPMRPWISALLIGVISILAVGCDGGQDTTGPSDTTPSDLVLRFVTPNSDDRAVMLSIDQAMNELRPLTGYRLFKKEVAGETRMIVLPEGGRAFPTGETAVASIRLDQENVTFRVRIEEVAAVNYGIRSSLEGYRTEVVEE